MTDKEIKEKVNQVLKLMEKQFQKAEPSLSNAMSRHDYFDKLEKDGHGLTQEQKRDFPFALTAQDIINNNVPWLAAGCTGCSRLFSHYARNEVGLNDFYVVLTVKTDQIGKKGNGQLSGHQVIAVQLSDGLHMIDVPRGLGKTFEGIEVKSECKVNNIMDFEKHKGYTIAAILTPEQYDNEITSYKDIKEKYLSCSVAKTILLKHVKTEVNKNANQQSYNNTLGLEHEM